MTTRWLILWLLIVAASVSLMMAIATRPARANDYCSTYDEVQQQAQRDGFPFTAIDPDRLPKVTEDAEALTGDTYADVTRGFFVLVPGAVLLGLETHGCLYLPIVMATPKGGNA